LGSDVAGDWPWPGDTPLVRARRVAIAYRARLLKADRAACDEFDAKLAEWGQTWIAPRLVTVDDCSVLGPAEAAEFLGVSVAEVRRLRLAGRLVGERVRGRWRYRVPDLRRLVEVPRSRKRRVDQGLA